MVSVIINTINEDESTLFRAVNSYLIQGAQVIISTIEGDKSLLLKGVEFAILKKEDHPGKSPKGSFIQLNNALDLIRGDWFCFASGNDYSSAEKLALEVKTCELYGKEVCYSAFYSVEGKRHVLKTFHDYDYTKHFNGNFVSDCALISTRLVKKYLPFKIEFNNYAFWDLWLRIFEGEGNVFVYNHVPTWFYIQNAEDMHNVRKRSPEQIKQANEDRERMLKTHL